MQKLIIPSYSWCIANLEIGCWAIRQVTPIFHLNKEFKKMIKEVEYEANISKKISSKKYFY